MPSTSSLLKNLKKDLPAITFAPGDTFRWSPQEQAIYFANTTDAAALLHEVAHAALGHAKYAQDIELLQMERDAWHYTLTTLSQKYQVAINAEDIENMLDTYRDWLHDRSRCPSCEATGVQIEANRYSCLACHNSWRVNEARSCALRRYKIK